MPEQFKSRTKAGVLDGAAAKSWVYLFNELDRVEADLASQDKDSIKGLLGGKGANLFEMTRLGLPVPPGFTISTEACNAYLKYDHQFPPGMWEQALSAVNVIEKLSKKNFGDPGNPLLVSCRSGARFSMPGMMDTVLNIGLNDETAQGLIAQSADSCFVYDSYRRLIQMFGGVVLGVADEPFEELIESRKKEKGVKLDTELDGSDWFYLVERFKSILKAYTGQDFPQDPYKQLEMSSRAVFNSWFGKRAVDYRNATGISHDLGTAVNIVCMVFGNMGNDSATGVAFTRNPVDGSNELYGDYLINAQGEDVVAGIRNTNPIAQLEQEMPAAFAEFRRIVHKLEEHFRDMQDVEFTIEKNKLWILQTRNGKRTARAAVKMAVDMALEGLISKKEALLRISCEQVNLLLHPQFAVEQKRLARDGGRLLINKAVNASPGAAVGQVVFDADTAARWAADNKSVIMVRPETKPDDVHGMIASKGILTSKGGATSHAAVVARQFGIPAICGAEALQIDVEHAMFALQINEREIVVKEGDWISIDGGSAEVFLGQLPAESPDFDREDDLKTLLSWADDVAALKVHANADYPKDAERARSYGACGVGLCRTEHMFFESDRLPLMQEMIMARSRAHRLSALERLLPLQRNDFEGIFKAMSGLPVIIRLLDPPLHEFLPSFKELSSELADLKLRLQHYNTLSEIDSALSEIQQKQDILKRVSSLSESNPMLGLRGDRLSVVMPEITEMQVRAIMEAALRVKKQGLEVSPRIMVPLAGHVNELRYVKGIVDSAAARVFSENGSSVDYSFGSMIEIPRAALTADEFASVAEFFSFGTNDLTQTTFGMSRDDAESKFLIDYSTKGIFSENPFQILDRGGVGRLIEMTVRLGRAVRPAMHMGICGEHGGEAGSIEFCHLAGLDYVSCSPFRVPVARLAAAQAALLNPQRRI